jgi:rhodanese-related sulfurtransferase
MMKKSAFVLVLLMISALVSVAARGNREPGELIDPQEASQLAIEGDALFVDVRSEAAYVQGHIAGAINAPLLSIPTSVGRLADYGKTLIFYCSCPNEETSIAASDELIRQGFEDVLVLRGGIGDWVRENRPVRTGGRP